MLSIYISLSIYVHVSLYMYIYIYILRHGFGTICLPSCLEHECVVLPPSSPLSCPARSPNEQHFFCGPRSKALSVQWLGIMPRLVSKSLSSRATRYIRCRPSPSPTVNVCSMPACPSRARPNLGGHTPYAASRGPNAPGLVRRRGTIAIRTYI